MISQEFNTIIGAAFFNTSRPTLVCMCEHTYVCMYVCIYVHMYVCMLYVGMYVCMYVCTYIACMFVYT